MNNFDVCRKNLMDRLGIFEIQTLDNFAMSREIRRMLDTLHDSVDLAKPRLIMGGIRYGSNWAHDDLMDYMQLKLTTYRETGNMEMLIDLVNFCGAIEPMLKTHPKFHFIAQDRRQ